MQDFSGRGMGEMAAARLPRSERQQIWDELDSLHYRVGTTRPLDPEVLLAEGKAPGTMEPWRYIGARSRKARLYAIAIVAVYKAEAKDLDEWDGAAVSTTGPNPEEGLTPFEIAAATLWRPSFAYEGLTRAAALGDANRRGTAHPEGWVAEVGGMMSRTAALDAKRDDEVRALAASLAGGAA
jgi:hypothetical protein